MEHPRTQFVPVLALAGMALALKILIGIAIALGAVFINGLFATLEDELPGGFDNPDGNQPLSSLTVRWLRILGVLAIAALLPIMVAASYAATSATGVADRLLDAGFATGAGALIGAITLRRRSLFWCGAVLIASGLAAGVAFR